MANAAGFLDYEVNSLPGSGDSKITASYDSSLTA